MMKRRGKERRRQSDNPLCSIIRLNLQDETEYEGNNEGEDEGENENEGRRGNYGRG